MPTRIYSTHGISTVQQGAREMSSEGHTNKHWWDWEAFEGYFHKEARKVSKKSRTHLKIIGARGVT